MKNVKMLLMKMLQRQKGFTLIEFLILIAILGILFAVIIPSIAGGKIGSFVNISNGNGQKIGQVVKLSKQGLWRKTWEGQLIRGGMSDGSGAFGVTPFNFTVEDEKLVSAVAQYMKEQREVVIEYTIEGVYSPLRSESSGNFLVSIRPIEKSDSGAQ